MTRTIAALAGALLFTLCASAGAQGAFPSRPVRMVVPVTPGGPADLVGRAVADKLGTLWGKPVVVDNKPGASGSIGADMVAKAPPDGYTLLMASANIAINPLIQAQMPFDTVKDLAPVSLTHLTPLVLAVSASLPVQTVAELVKYARDNPGKLSYGTSGNGSTQQLATLLFEQTAKVARMTEVPYKGSTAAHPDLISGRVSLMIDPVAAILPHIKSGAVRALAVTTASRIAALPDVPTMQEAGLAGYEVVSWGAIFAPAGTPADLVGRISADITRSLETAEMRNRFQEMGLIAKPSSPQQMSAFLQSEMQRWAGVMQAAKQ